MGARPSRRAPIGVFTRVLAQKLTGALGMGGGGEDRPAIIAQNLKPGGDIGRVVLAILKRNPEIGAEKRSPEFRDQLFAGIGAVGKALLPEIPIQAGFVARPVDALMPERRVIGRRIAEGLEGRDHDLIRTRRIISASAFMTYGSAKMGEKGLSLGNAIIRIARLARSLRLREEPLRQTVDLLDVEDGVGLQKRNDAGLALGRAFARLRAQHLVGIDDRRSLLCESAWNNDPV